MNFHVLLMKIHEICRAHDCPNFVFSMKASNPLVTEDAACGLCISLLLWATAESKVLDVRIDMRDVYFKAKRALLRKASAMQKDC